ncbi:hypothetical protein Tco_0842186 [Tanacetum coccineum]|uniref:Uncharacterized protein n=1 Tax=Tanacetum coccineum TaxID=301880 RepID=A0ABQ5B2X7_9ASTR
MVTSSLLSVQLVVVAYKEVMEVLVRCWSDGDVVPTSVPIPEDETPELITELQNVDKHVPTIFDRARMEATLNDMLKAATVRKPTSIGRIQKNLLDRVSQLH